MLKTSFQSKFSDDDDEDDTDTGASELDQASNSSQAHLPSKLEKTAGNGHKDKEEEDDIPLAQSIPGALRAQKSIRVRDKAYLGSRAKPQTEAKQSTSTEFTEKLARKLTQLKYNSPAAIPQPAPASPSVMRTNQMHSSFPDAPPSRPSQSVSPSTQNVFLPSASRPRNKSLSQPQFALNVDPIRHKNEQPVLSRSSTQLPSSKTSQSIQLSTDLSARPAAPPFDRAQTMPVRARSKSFSSSKPSTHPSQFNDQVHKPPPLPNLRSIPIPISAPPDNNVLQQRVFIDSMQRFNIVLIRPHTSAYEIITTVASQGELGSNGNNTIKDWMLWEIVHDFGLERPIRSYERPSEIYASWNTDTRLNAFMLKKTPLSSILAPDKIPNSSPTFNGYVQWESKRGKWNKRWMELSEHSIWLSKRNTGKDRTFLCSVSNFDCYFMSRQYKAPRSFVFALKSTDNLTMFENPADYLHVFSCDPKDGVRWTQAILLARSYVLHKERTVLFTTSAVSSMTPVNADPHLDHHDRKKSLSLKKPLLQLKTRQNESKDDNKEFFRSGSLLARS